MYYAYYRVSTETQAEKGGGLETQRQNVHKYCADNGIEIAREFTDAGISGALQDTDEEEAISKRPALVEMLATMKEGDTVIVMNTSRLWRSDTAKVIIRRDLKKKHAHIIAIENPRFDLYAKNPNEKFMDSIMENIDEWERETIALKMAKGRLAKAKTGAKPSGIAPIGYKYSADKKSVLIDEETAPIVKMMFTEAQKGRSLRDLAAMLNDKDIKTKRGKQWTAGTVQSVLHNTFYIGLLTHDTKEYRKQPGYKPNFIQGTHEPLISKIQFGKVQKQLEKRRR